jgi:hypothetical protein
VALAFLPILGVGLPRPPLVLAAEQETLTNPQAEIHTVVNAYIQLYARETLSHWKTLFHPALTVADPAADGTIRVRNLEEFFAAQKGYFESGRAISERLEDVRIDPGRRIARVNADFVFTDNGEERRGKLGLHLAQGNEGWTIMAIVFSYDQPR